MAAYCDPLETFQPSCQLISIENELDRWQAQVELINKTDHLILLKEILLSSVLAKWQTDDDVDDDDDDHSNQRHKSKQKTQSKQHQKPLLTKVVDHLKKFVIRQYSYKSGQHCWQLHRIADTLQTNLTNHQQSLDNEHEFDFRFALITDQNYAHLHTIASSQLLRLDVSMEELMQLYHHLGDKTTAASNNTERKEAHQNNNNNNKLLQSVLIRLKNSLFENAVLTGALIDRFSIRYQAATTVVDTSVKCNLFDKIYLQALIHTLKNENKQSMLSILLRCPDLILSDDHLLIQVLDYYLTGTSSSSMEDLEQKLLELYCYSLYRFTSHLVCSIYRIRFANAKFQTPFFQPQTNSYFNLKDCFLLAVQDGKHFLTKFQKIYTTNAENIIISSLPLKFQILVILISLYEVVNVNQNEMTFISEKMARFESNISNLLLKYEYENMDNVDDCIFVDLVEKLQFVLRFTDWCYRNLNHNGVERNIFNFGIIVSLLSGNSPLKILSNYGFLQLKQKGSSINLQQKCTKDVSHEEICNLIQQFNPSEAMVLQGFIVLRNVFLSLFLNDDEAILYFDVNFIKSHVQELMPINFRIEILENLFSLLFLNKSDLNHNINGTASEDEDYLDETISPTKLQNINELNNASKRKSSSLNSTKTSCFLCPNWVIPHMLELLKEVLYKTSSDLYNISRHSHQSNQAQRDTSPPRVGLPNLDNSFTDCKTRVELLIKHVADAQFRYDVIRPAFYKNISMKTKPIQTEEADQTDVAASSNLLLKDQLPDLNRELISTNSSDAEQRGQSHLSNSLISCMLTSHTQLLCYTLIENSVDNAHKVVRLFKQDLKDAKELKELYLLEYNSELHTKMCAAQLEFSQNPLNSTTMRSSTFEDVSTKTDTKFKIGKLASMGIRTTKIQSLVYEMLLHSDKLDSLSKKVFLVDYALSSSPTLETSQAILDSVFMHNSNMLSQTNSAKQSSSRLFPEKVESFIVCFQKMITDLTPHIDISQMSMNDYLEKSSNSANLLNAHLFVKQLRLEVELRQLYSQFSLQLNMLENRIMDRADGTQTLPNAKQLENTIRRDSQLLLTLFDKLAKLCPSGKFHYLQGLMLYIRKVSKALLECCKRNQQVTNEGPFESNLFCFTSYFSILKQSPSAILCSMVIKSKISPKIIDDLAWVMKVDLIGVLCSVFCPSIVTCCLLECDYQFFVSDLCHPALLELMQSYSKSIDNMEFKFIQSNLVSNFFAKEVDDKYGLVVSSDQSFQPLINDEVLNYFNSKCSVLVDLLQIMHLTSERQVANITSFPMHNIHIYPDSPLLKWIDTIKRNFFFGEPNSSVLLAFYPRIMAGHSAVMKALEYYVANQNYLQIYNLFRYIDDIASSNNDTSGVHEFDSLRLSSYQTLKNVIYSRLVFMQENSKFIFQIVRDPKLKCKLICRLLTHSNNYDETFMATRLLRLCLQSICEDESIFDLDVTECRKKLERFLAEIEFYAAVGQLTGLKTWKLAKDNLSSIDVLTIIKIRKRYRLAIEWYNIHGLEKETCDLHIELLIHAYSEINDYISLRKLFHSIVEEMQSIDIIAIVEKTLNMVENLDLRSFLVDLLVNFNRKKMNSSMVQHYEQYKLGIEILKILSNKIRDDYLQLVSCPLVLIEQLFMNGEIDPLERILHQYKLLNADELVERYAQKAVYIDIYYSHSHSFSSGDLTQTSNSINESKRSLSQQQFVVPDKIPSKEQWVSDTAETHCMICHLVRFSMINRRHHCRRCGRVVCQTCSPHTYLIVELNQNVQVRVCKECYQFMNRNTRKTSTHSTNSSNSLNSLGRRTNWLLSPIDEVYNETRRQEFNYESAPSVTLCLAILRLHSNKKQCCRFIIDKICAPLLESTDSHNVDSTLLIEMIRSLLISTRISIEEDINIYDSGHKQQTAEIEQLNFYLDRLDVIRIMINFNYGTKEMIGYILGNNIQKLQEKLLEMERFELAIDIAKKYGLDSSSIWKTWATICLKHFHFSEARHKFSRYFDQITRTNEIQQTLKNIVDILVRNNCANSQQLSSKEKCQMILSGQYEFLSSTNRTGGGGGGGQHRSKEANNDAMAQHLKPRIFQEITYYLQQYGSPEDLLRFYVDHFYWKEAVEYFVTVHRDGCSHSVAINTFLNNLFIPAQMHGVLHLLLAGIRQSDAQLSHLWSCLISVCKYLDKNNFYYSLYQVQLFMSDYLRAAITQINCFFLNPSFEHEIQQQQANIDLNSFKLLCLRMVHLEKARDNCSMYLHNIEYVKLKPGCLHVDKKEVLKQIRLIEMQIEILKRFNVKQVSYPLTALLRSVESTTTTSSSSSSSSAQKSSVATRSVELHLPLDAVVLRSFESRFGLQLDKWPYPPTLLEHDIVRKSLITSFVILFFGDSIEEGFRYSLRIIQDHQLCAKTVYQMTASYLLAYELERNTNISQVLEHIGQLLHYVQSSYSSNVQESDRPGPSMMQNLDASMRRASISQSASDLQVAMNKLCDEIVVNCINTVKLLLSSQKVLSVELATSSIARAKLAELNESLIKLLSDDKQRIEAYLREGKLKLAYLLAVSLGQHSHVAEVLARARQLNDQHYVRICEMWFKKNDPH